MNKNSSFSKLALTGLFSLYATAAAAAASITPMVLGDFEDGTNQGWWWSGQPTSVIPNAGPSGYGDYALLAPANPDVFKLNALNDQPIGIGDYLSLGVRQVTFSAMNPSTNVDDLNLHVVLYSGAGVWPYDERWVSYNAASVPNESDMVRAKGSYEFEDVLSNVTMISLRHQDMPYQEGGTPLSSMKNSVYLDDINLGLEDIPGLGKTGPSRQLKLTFTDEVYPVPDWRWRDAFGRVIITPSWHPDNPSREGQPVAPGFEFDVRKLGSLDTFGYINDYDGRNAYAIYMWTEAYGRTRVKTFQSQFLSESYTDQRWLWGFSDQRLLIEDMCVEVWVERDDGIDAPDMLSYSDGNWSFPVLRAESAEGVCSTLKD